MPSYLAVSVTVAVPELPLTVVLSPLAALMSMFVMPPGVAAAHAQAKLTSSVSPSNSAFSVAWPDARLMLPVAGRAVPAGTSVPFP